MKSTQAASRGCSKAAFYPVIYVYDSSNDIVISAQDD